MGAPYGVKGWVHVTSYTSPPENIALYKPWTISSNAGQRLTLDPAVKAHKSGFIAHVADDRTAATSFGRVEVYVAKTHLPDAEEDEVYWQDLLGCDVQLENGEPLGRVVDLMETGAHDVMVISDESRQTRCLIPFADQYVTTVDIERKQLTVNWNPDWL